MNQPGPDSKAGKRIRLKSGEKVLVKLFVLLLRCIAWTSRTEIENEAVVDEALRLHEGFIVSTWHRDIFFSIWMFRELHLTAMISASRDGEGIFQVMRHFNFSGIRGSSNRGGSEALIETGRLLKEGGGVAIAPDGPTGPSLAAKPGIILLARDTQVPIIPWSYACRGEWLLKTWDRHRVPKPFNRIRGSYGEPMHIPPDLPMDQIPAYCRKLEEAMRDITDDLRSE